MMPDGPGKQTVRDHDFYEDFEQFLDTNRYLRHGTEGSVPPRPILN